MYDDIDRSTLPDSAVGRGPEGSIRTPLDTSGHGGELELCPECRALLAAAIGAVPSQGTGAHSGLAGADHRGWSSASVPSPEPEDPSWQRAMRWLDAHCGGREAVLRLNARPLPEPLGDRVGTLGSAPRERVRAILPLTDAAAERFFDLEFRRAVEHAVVLVAAHQPGLLTLHRPAAVAHGTIWAVARANALLAPQGLVTDRSLREFLGSTHAGSAIGRKVQVALRSLFVWPDPSLPGWRWPRGRMPLEPLGHVGLLTAPVRARLVEVRERALHEAALELRD